MKKNWTGRESEVNWGWIGINTIMEQEHEELHREWIRMTTKYTKSEGKGNKKSFFTTPPQKTHPNKFDHFIYYRFINHYWEWAHCIYMYKNYPFINHCLTFLSMMGMKKSCRFWTPPFPPQKKSIQNSQGFHGLGMFFLAHEAMRTSSDIGSPHPVGLNATEKSQQSWAKNKG